MEVWILPQNLLNAGLHPNVFTFKIEIGKGESRQLMHLWHNKIMAILIITSNWLIGIWIILKGAGFEAAQIRFFFATGKYTLVTFPSIYSQEQWGCFLGFLLGTTEKAMIISFQESPTTFTTFLGCFMLRNQFLRIIKCSVSCSKIVLNY